MSQALTLVCWFAAVEFYMPPICSPLVRPGRPSEIAPVISKQLSDTIMRHVKYSAFSFFYLFVNLSVFRFYV